VIYEILSIWPRLGSSYVSTSSLSVNPETRRQDGSIFSAPRMRDDIKYRTVFSREDKRTNYSIHRFVLDANGVRSVAAISMAPWEACTHSNSCYVDLQYIPRTLFPSLHLHNKALKGFPWAKHKDV
jgi:hypothetical protein